MKFKKKNYVNICIEIKKNNSLKLQNGYFPISEWVISHMFKSFHIGLTVSWMKYCDESWVGGGDYYTD